MPLPHCQTGGPACPPPIVVRSYAAGNKIGAWCLPFCFCPCGDNGRSADGLLFASLGAPYHTLAELREAAETAVDEIQARVDSMRQNGGLKQVNAEYKRYRAQQIAKAEKATPYAKFLERFTALIVRDVAMAGRGDRVTI
jgi:hypothetical protein